MLQWQPERIILAHGRWYAHDGTAELRRAFRWVKGLSSFGMLDSQRTHQACVATKRR
ncbi:MAG: hypothetical protein H6999_11365 [Hahellaceae bacterium]|nr:hypothetical protein [Hahellaceae bacterium]